MTAPIVVRRVSVTDYAGLDAAFAELAVRAAEPNPHLTPSAVAAAARYAGGGGVVILSAWRSEALGMESLAGIWALHRRRGWRSGFSAVLQAPLLPLYEVSSAPVLDRDQAQAAAAALLRHVAASADLPKTLSLPLLPLEGETFAALQGACTERGARLTLFERWSRPVMIAQAGDDAERYLRRALGQGYKKRMQQFRAIGRSGVVSFSRERGEAARAAFETFLALEAAGWKGEAGTAIARLPAAAAYFRDLVAHLAGSDAVQVDALRLDGKPIAMGVLVESGGVRNFLKIAYDEGSARHSPGRALTIAMIQADFAGRPAAFFDSGAGDGVDAGTYVWGERRVMAHAILRLGGGVGLAEAAAGARMALRRVRARARRE